MLDKILALINAGFTAEQIVPLLGRMSPEADSVPAPGPAPAPVPVPVSVPAPVPENPAPAPAPGAGAPVAPGAVDVAGISAAIQAMGDNIIKALQRAQIGGSTVPAPLDPDAQLNAITAQIINPTRKDGANNG